VVCIHSFGLQVSPVEWFLEKANGGRSRSSSRSSSPGRSPVRYVDEQIHGFKVNLKPERKSKFSSVVLKIRGIDQVAAICPFFFFFCLFILVINCSY
jgi:hypothetical protein